MEYAVLAHRIAKKFPRQKSFRDLLLRPFEKRKVDVLERIDLQVRKGDLFALLGPNGAGKTTLIKILCTMVIPDDGTAFVGGFDIRRDAKAVRNRIGYVVSEERSFYWRLTGRQNLKFFAALGNLFGADAEGRIGEVLRITGMAPHADRMFKDYSTGMKQRLSIARGLLQTPEVLFLDEPTKSLDPVAAAEIRKFIREELVGKEGKTVVVATNNMQEAEEMSDRLAILRRGVVAASGTLREIRDALAFGNGSFRVRFRFPAEGSLHGLRKELEAAGMKWTLLREARDGEAEARVDCPQEGHDASGIFERAARCGIRIEECRREEPSLDEVFAKLVH